MLRILPQFTYAMFLTVSKLRALSEDVLEQWKCCKKKIEMAPAFLASSLFVCLVQGSFLE